LTPPVHSDAYFGMDGLCHSDQVLVSSSRSKMNKV
jgi:hypothetical protein